MKYLISILCLFIFSCDDGDCLTGDYDCNGICNGYALYDDCGVCGGQNECLGCTDDSSVNYDESATLDDGSCIYCSELSYFTDFPLETGESSAVIIQYAPGLEPCDEIGLFDTNGVLENTEPGYTPLFGELLVGAGIWTGEQLIIAGIESVDLSQFGGPVLNGCVSGNPITYKVWKSSENEVYNANATISNGNGNWGEILTVVSYLEPMFIFTQNIDLNPNTFNMISFNVSPEDNLVASVFSELDILFIKNGNGEYYASNFGVDQIINIETNEAYRVLLNGSNSQTLSIEGTHVNIATSILLSPYTGNMVSFPLQECILIDNIIGGYNNEILLIKNDKNDFYLPAFGISTLTEMCPGNGYEFFLNTNDYINFSYQSGGISANNDNYIAFWNDYKIATRRNDVAVTGLSHLILITGIYGNVEAGGILRAYSNDTLVGSINIISEHLTGIFPIDLVANGMIDLSDIGGPVLDGYIRGDEINLSYYSHSTQTEYAVEYDLDVNVYGLDSEMSVGVITVLNELASP